LAVEATMGDVIDQKVFKLKRGKYCPHTQSSVDRYQRIVECVKCGALLDPFDVVLDLAQEEDRYTTSIQRLRKENERLDKDIQELKRQERNAKARLRRLRTKEGKSSDA